MVKTLSVIFGIGLAILWIVGLGAPTGSWMAWLDLVGAVASFFMAGGVSDYSSRNMRVGSPFALAVGLYALWIIGVTTGAAPAWMSWWNFAFALAYTLVGIGGSREHRFEAARPGTGPTGEYTVPPSDEFRKTG